MDSVVTSAPVGRPASESRRRIEADVRTLAAAARHHKTSPEHHAQSAEHVAASLEAAGCDVRRQEFALPGGGVGVNINGEMRGRDATQSLVVGAHYDTRPNSPGADDNASGVAAMLECARLLSGRRPRRSVEFVAFDAEERQDPEKGLWGSSAYVGSLPAGQVKAAFILEMVGFTSGARTQRVPLGMRVLFPAAALSVMRHGYEGDFLIALTRGRGKRLARTLARHANRPGGPRVLTLGLPGWLPPPGDLLRSDHAPFWAAGVPVVMVGDTANFRNPNYHMPSDTSDTLDYGLIEHFTAALAATVAEVAGEA